MRANGAWVPIVLALSILAAPAAGHGRLVRTAPAADAVLTTAPTEIQLDFDEPVIAALSGITVREESGEEWTAPASPSASDATRVVVPLPEALKPGRFEVHWRVVSPDMHKSEGDFGFEVAPP